jgi:hypothetical protein
VLMSDMWGGRCRTGSGCGGDSKTMHSKTKLVVFFLTGRGPFGDDKIPPDDAASIIIQLLQQRRCSVRYYNPHTNENSH